MTLFAPYSTLPYQALQRRLWMMVLALVSWLVPATGAEQAGLIHISGAIGPATASYLQRAIQEASIRKYDVLLIRLDTPGDLLESTKEMAQSLYASPLPTVVYVAPAGATAASAGCFITLAADVAAMAPGTSIGAAHPVEMGAGGGSQQPDEVMKTKLENWAAAYIESIASRRHRAVTPLPAKHAGDLLRAEHRDVPALAHRVVRPVPQEKWVSITLRKQQEQEQGRAGKEGQE